MGGSALTQLKSSLRASGLSRTSAPKDPKKRNKARKELSSTSQAHRQAKLEAIGNDFNKFDIREEKKKFDVVTRQGRLEEAKKGAPGKSRAAGVELRKKTLLPMLEGRNHVSTFVDRRFGEASSTLTPEEKALERFTAERQSRLNSGGKKSRFNLEDDDDEAAAGDDGFTHGGQKLGFGDEEELEHGGWGGLGAAVEGGASSSNREPLLRRRMAEAKDEDDQPERKKTKAEVMEEVMIKSKSHKFERQRIRSADDEARHALDAELRDLRGLLGGTGRMPRPALAKSSSTDAAPAAAEGSDEEEDDDDDEDSEGDEDDSEAGDDSDEDGSEGSTYELNDEELEAALAAAGKPGVDRELLRKLIGGGGDSDSEDEAPSKKSKRGDDAAPEYDLEDGPRPAASAAPEKEADPYDSYVRMLALEPRAVPSDRLKTPLEMAKDAAEELKEREEKRLKRQRGEKDESEDEGDGREGKKGKKDKKRAPQGDDLEDDYFRESGSEGEEEDEGLGKGLEGGFGHQVIVDESEEEGSEDEEEEEEEEGNESEDEESGDDLDIGDIEAEDSDEELDSTGHEALVSAVTIEEPTKRKWGGEDVKPELPFTFPCPTTHAEFVRLLRSSGIAESDTATVVKRIRVLYHPGLGESNKEKLQVFTHVLLDHILHLSSNPSPTSYSTINSLLPPLLTLSHAYPLTTAPYYVSKLSLMQKNFTRGVVVGPLDPSAKTWPGAAELTLLRLVGMTWSTSDLSHPVVAAAMLLIGQYLAQARIRSLADIAAGLFLCTVVGQYEEQSKRLAPEVVNFLLNALLVLVPSSFASIKSLPGFFPAPDFAQDHVKSLRLKSATASSLAPSAKVDFVKSLAATKSKKDDAQLKVDLVATTFRLLTDLSVKYVSLDAFVEVFRPIEAVLGKLSTKAMSPELKTQHSTLVASLHRMLNLSSTQRKPLLLQHHKPIPIATFIPKFDEGFNPNRRFDPDTERAEQQKVKALYKKEKKGAIRELRKDNRFLAGEEVKRKAEADAVYSKKIAKIMGSIEAERGEEKAHLRAKIKGKLQDKARSARSVKK